MVSDVTGVFEKCNNPITRSMKKPYYLVLHPPSYIALLNTPHCISCIKDQIVISFNVTSLFASATIQCSLTYLEDLLLPSALKIGSTFC